MASDLVDACPLPDSGGITLIGAVVDLLPKEHRRNYLCFYFSFRAVVASDF